MNSSTTLRPPLGARLQPVVSERLAKKFSRNLKERAIEAVLFLAAFVSVVTTAGIVYILVKESVVFFAEVPLWRFLTDPSITLYSRVIRQGTVAVDHSGNGYDGVFKGEPQWAAGHKGPGPRMRKSSRIRWCPRTR